MEQFQRSQIDDVLFLVLRTIYHFEHLLEVEYGLDFEEIYVLQYLRYHPDARLTEIAAEMELPKFAVSRLISRLIENGHISKTQDPVDRRNFHIQLETKGEEAVKVLENANFQRISSNLQHLSRDEIDRLVTWAENLHLILGVTDKVIKPS